MSIKYRIWDNMEQRMYAQGEYKHLYSSGDKPLVLLYLGHKDAKGTEIYEHDIVKVRYPYVADVAYYVASMTLPIFGCATALVTENRGWNWEVCEIVGNIHEDKELLAFVK